MKFPGAIMMGASVRLLPPSVPFRYFVGAAFFQMLSWALLASAYDQIASFQGGPGPVLAAIHALTIGVMLSVAMGASFQMLPVAMGEALATLWPARLAAWLLYPGLAAQLYGFYMLTPLIMLIGGLLTAGAIGLFIVLIGDVYRRSKVMILLVRHGWGAMAGLIILTGLGILLILDLEHGFLPDHPAIAGAHMIIASFGFMGLLAMGYSQILVPMFSLAPSPDQRRSNIVLILAVAAIGLAATNAAFQISPILTYAGASVGIIAALLHIKSMLAILGKGMKKNLGLSFLLVRISWGVFPLMLAAGALASAGWLGPNGPALFGFLLLCGWLLTFLLGILQRIIPFLATMNASNAGKTPPRPSKIANEALLKYHAGAHISAFLVVAVGIFCDWNTLILVGALIGLAGALIFFVFTVDVLRRMITYTSGKTGK